MKKIIICILVTLISFSSFAQMGVLGKKAAKQIELLKERPLLVVLWDDGELDGYNKNIKKAIEEVWTFSSDIKYITKDEWKKLSKDKDEAKKYAHFYYTKKMLRGNAPNNSLVIGIMEKAVSTNFYYTPEVGFADLMLALNNIQTDLEMGVDYEKVLKAKSKEFVKFLKDSIEYKTLYIDEALVTKKLLKKIGSTYNYDYKLVSKEEIDNAIVNKNKNVLFVRELVRAQRPRTSSSLPLGESRTSTKMKIKRTSSMSISLNLVYKASDLEQVGIAGVKMGSLDEDNDKKREKLDIKGIKMFLKYIQ